MITQVKNIRYAVQEKNNTGYLYDLNQRMVSIDLKKAFDTLDHKMLVKKLCHYGGAKYGVEMVSILFKR